MMIEDDRMGKIKIMDYREQIKKVLEGLPEEQLKVALGFLSCLRSSQLSKQINLESIYPWLKYLSDSERDKFFKELLEAISNSTENSDWRKLEEVIDGWQETAEILSDRKLMQEIREAEAQIQKGETIPWNEVKRRLNIK